MRQTQFVSKIIFQRVWPLFKQNFDIPNDPKYTKYKYIEKFCQLLVWYLVWSGNRRTGRLHYGELNFLMLRISVGIKGGATVALFLIILWPGFWCLLELSIWWYMLYIIGGFIRLVCFSKILSKFWKHTKYVSGVNCWNKNLVYFQSSFIFSNYRLG